MHPRAEEKWLRRMHSTQKYVFYLRQHTLTHASVETTLDIRGLVHEHSCYACISLLASAVCISQLQILLYTARCLLLAQRRNPQLNSHNPAPTWERLSGYMLVNISCSVKPPNYLFDTQVNVLNKRNTYVALTVSSLAHYTDPLPGSQRYY